MNRSQPKESNVHRCWFRLRTATLHAPAQRVFSQGQDEPRAGLRYVIRMHGPEFRLRTAFSFMPACGPSLFVSQLASFFPQNLIRYSLHPQSVDHHCIHFHRPLFKLLSLVIEFFQNITVIISTVYGQLAQFAVRSAPSKVSWPCCQLANCQPSRYGLWGI